MLCCCHLFQFTFCVCSNHSNWSLFIEFVWDSIEFVWAVNRHGPWQMIGIFSGGIYFLVKCTTWDPFLFFKIRLFVLWRSTLCPSIRLAGSIFIVFLSLRYVGRRQSDFFLKGGSFAPQTKKLVDLFDSFMFYMGHRLSFESRNII